jgi:hypothetical protein
MDIETMTGGKHQVHHKKADSCNIGKFEVKEKPVDVSNLKCKSLEDHPVKLIEHTVSLLKESEAVMFGHEQCGYCKKQVELFAKPTEDSRILKGIYVDCKDHPEKCKDIQGYPTWNIAGKTFVGLHNISDLCQIAELAVEDKAESLNQKSPKKHHDDHKHHHDHKHQKPKTCESLENNPKKLAQHTLEVLKESDATFYGHEQCGYCKKQTELFVKNSGEKTPLKDLYVNCQIEPEKCKGITGFPTWEIGGKKFVGYHDMKDLCKIAELAIE